MLMQRSLMLRLGLGLTVTVLVHAVAGSVWGQDFKTILANPERPQNERALDSVRKPEEMLRFYGVKAGDRVADLMAGRGYYTAILSQLVGEKGVGFYAHETNRK